MQDIFVFRLQIEGLVRYRKRFNSIPGFCFGTMDEQQSNASLIVYASATRNLILFFFGSLVQNTNISKPRADRGNCDSSHKGYLQTFPYWAAWETVLLVPGLVATNLHLFQANPSEIRAFDDLHGIFCSQLPKCLK